MKLRLSIKFCDETMNADGRLEVSGDVLGRVTRRCVCVECVPQVL